MPISEHEQGGEATPDKPVAAEARIGNAASLQELSADYAFYTLAIPELLCPLPEHPLTALSKTLGQEQQQLLLRFDRPVFSGFRNAYDHTICALPREHWPVFAEQLRGTVLADRELRLLRQFRLRDLQVTDALEVQRRGFSTGQAVTVTAVCLETNRGCYYVDDSAGLQTPPVLRYTPDTFPDFVQFAETIFGPSQGA